MNRLLSLACLLAAPAPLQAQCDEAVILAGHDTYAPVLQTAMDGSYLATTRSSSSGFTEVSIHERIGGFWSEVERLSTPGIHLGTSLALQGNVLAVSNSGQQDIAVYTRTINGWSLDQSLTAPVAFPLEGFGQDLALSADGSMLVVGAPYSLVAGFQDAGRVYVYERSGGSFQLTADLPSPQPMASTFFGWEVECTADLIVASAPNFQSGLGALASWRLAGGVWTPEPQVVSPGTAFFGASIAFDGGLLAVGAPRGAGAVYLYGHGPGGFALQETFLGQDPGDGLGSSVDLQGLLIVAGAPGSDTNDLNSGSAAVFAPGFVGWLQIATLFPADPFINKHFGVAVAVQDQRAVVGSLAGSGGGHGGAYAFDPIGICDGTTFGQAVCVPGQPNSTGFGASLEAHGSPIVGNSNLGLWAGNLRPGLSAFLIVGQTPGQVSIGQGVFCLGAPFGRLVDQLQQAEFAGGMEFRVPLGAMPMSPAVAVLPGETWFFQCVYRDLNPGPTFNFTDALAITFQ